MKLLLATILISLWLSEPALATCTQSTVMMPDGRMLMCMTCCVAQGMCQTTCH